MDAKTDSRALPRQRQKTDARQREIVAAVLALARERGPDSITTQAIADRIGVTQGALFRHFPDKEAIWLAVFAWVREALGAVLDAAVAKADTPLAQLKQAFLAHVAFVAANPGVPRVLFHELQYPGDSPVRVAVGTMIARLQQAPGGALHARQGGRRVARQPRCHPRARAVHRRRAGSRHPIGTRGRRGGDA